MIVSSKGKILEMDEVRVAIECVFCSKIETCAEAIRNKRVECEKLYKILTEK